MYTMLQLKAKGGCWKLLLSHFDSSHQTPVYPTHPDSLDGCALLCQFGCGLCPRGRLQNLQRNWFGKWKTHIFLTKLQYFTNLDFWWNKGISIPQRPFGVRSCEVAIIWPADLCSITAADFSRLSNICRRVLAASGNLRLQKRQQASSMDLAPGIGVNLGTQFVGKKIAIYQPIMAHLSPRTLSKGAPTSPPNWCNIPCPARKSYKSSTCQTRIFRRKIRHLATCCLLPLSHR